ncbi:hypothetical protein [Scytonema sp. HK-05]|uniref:hypothetical protein n=1 Tax=Scytonema sp. HK-05 TaxID=1137095 RepID=UPI0009374925|nr:hypothetical protein [Scytonema sp. HK-05]
MIKELEPPPQTLLEPLLELRDYYAALACEYERLWQTARSQLVHVEALLSNWSAVNKRDNLTAVVETFSFAPTPVQHDSLSRKQLDRISNVDQQEAIEPELADEDEQQTDVDDVEQDKIESELALEDEQQIDVDDVEQDKIEPELTLEDEQQIDVDDVEDKIESELAVEDEQQIDVDDVEQDKIESELAVEDEQQIDVDDVEQDKIESELAVEDEQQIDVDEESSDAEDTVVTAPALSQQQETQTQNNDNSILGTDVPMLPEYQVLTRMQAIEKILRDHIGTVCHIDFIVRSLFGDLEPSVFKVVKSRVQSSLTHGKEKGYWAAFPDEPGCYTLDLNLVTPPNGKVKSNSIKPKRKKPFLLSKAKRVPMLPEFEGKFLIDAICILLQRNSGKIFSVAEVITGLYGELNAEQLREIKTAVHNELSRGHRIGRFSRVPHKIGCYTWDLKKIQTK